MSAAAAFHTAVRDAKANPPVPAWSWRTTGNRDLFELWTGGQSVGTVALLPGHIEHRGVFMDDLVELINTKHR